MLRVKHTLLCSQVEKGALMSWVGRSLTVGVVSLAGVLVFSTAHANATATAVSPPIPSSPSAPIRGDRTADTDLARDSSRAITPSQIVSLFNAQRVANGLPTVTENADWSAACALHNTWGFLNNKLEHSEIPGTPGYTAAGNWAAGNAVLAHGDGWSANSPWNSAPIHLSQMLSPRLKRVGAATNDERGCFTTWPGYDWSGTSPTKWYPGPGTTVDAGMRAYELPTVPGVWVGLPEGTETGPYLYLYTNSSQDPVSGVTLTGPSGPVEVRVVDRNVAGEYAGYLATTAMVIPVRPLQKGVSYTVAATVGLGQSAVTTRNTFSTRKTVPDAPASATAVLGNRQATVSWTPPPDTGGTPITAYIVTAWSSTAGTGNETTCPVTTSCTITGLNPGHVYGFAVRARNAIGDGPSTPWTTWTRMWDVPSGMGQATATGGVGQARVSWTPPDDGGQPITSYVIEPVLVPYAYAGPEFERILPARTCPATTNSCLITGLGEGTYSFRLRARNMIGLGEGGGYTDYIDVSEPRQITAPGAPIGTTALPANSAAHVRWRAPASNGGSPITGYIVTATPGGRQCTTSTLTCTLTGLRNGQPYRFTVRAVNAAGQGQPSAPTVAVTPTGPPTAPRSVRITYGPTPNRARLDWAPPASNGGQPLLGYRLRTRTVGSPTFGNWFTMPATARSRTFAKLPTGRADDLQLVAYNARGHSAAVLIRVRAPH